MQRFIKYRLRSGLLNEGKLISEGMNLHIKDFSYDTELDTILNICHASWKSFMDIYNNDFTKEEEDIYSDKGFGYDMFSPDGSYAFESTGIMNFYMAGVPKRLLGKITSKIKYDLSERDVILGKISDVEDNRVIRMHVTKNDSTHGNPPDFQLSNTNAHLIFGNILGLDDMDSSYEMNVGMLLSKVDKAMEEFEAMPSSPSTVTTSGEKGNIYQQHMGSDDILSRLSRIRDFAQWASDRGYSELYMA